MSTPKNLLSLHEAIVIALININKETFSASFLQIANYIEQHQLYPDRKGNVSLEKQVELRSTLSNNMYAYLFKKLNNDTIQLYPTAKSSLK